MSSFNYPETALIGRVIESEYRGETIREIIVDAGSQTGHGLHVMVSTGHHWDAHQFGDWEIIGADRATPDTFLGNGGKEISCLRLHYNGDEHPPAGAFCVEHAPGGYWTAWYEYETT